MKHIWENPEIQELNRLPMRSPLIPFDSADAARSETAAGPESCPFSKSPYIQTLDGKWKFSLLDSPDADKTGTSYEKWVCPSFNDTNWADSTVPGTWTLQGFDKPHYTNIQMPFDCLPPNVSKQNPTGLYRLAIQIPNRWNNRRIVLHIGSAESCTIVYVNGTEAGVSKDTRLPCEFDITPYLDWKNGSCSTVIAIKVIRYSDASFVEDQDQWWFGGIHRSVYLYSTEQTFIQDVEALSYVEQNDRSSGIIPLTLTLGYADIRSAVTRTVNSEMDTLKRIVKYTVHKLDGTPQKGTVGKLIASGTAEGCYNYRQTLNQVRTDIHIPDVKLWSHESPELYILTVSLYEQGSGNAADRHIESVSFTTGFKTVELKNRELQINGKMVYIKGVNRHEHSEHNGKTLSTGEMVRDLHMLKQYNFNAVRTCHYPDDERWYELCDRYGIYVMDEANIENHAYYDCITRSDEWTYAYMTRVQRMVRRDKNHASVFCWSLGNESGDGPNQVACGAWLRRIDKTRLVHYEGFVRGEIKQTDFSLDTLARGKGLTDLISPMYPPIDLIVKYADTREDYRPIIMCEYSHAMGNANGSLSDYWRAIESHHGLQGGFIWDWIDQGLAAEEPKGKPGTPQGGKYWKYGGDFGDTPTDYDFCINGLNFPDMTPKPAMEECRKLFAPVRLYPVHAAQGLFEIENRYDFSPLDKLTLTWSFLKNGTAVQTGSIPLPAILPGERTPIAVPAGDVLASCGTGELVFHADFVYTEDCPWAKAGDICGSDECSICQATDWIDFSATDRHVVKTAEHTPDTSFVQKCKPILFRPLLENECIKKSLPYRHDPLFIWHFQNKPTNDWLDADIPGMIVKETAPDTFELLTGADASVPGKFGTMKRTISSCSAPDGSDALQLDVTFTLTNHLAEYPRVGIQFPVSAQYKSVSWYGRGPQECYSDRKAGAMLGLYTASIADLEVPYIVPQENGNRCDVRYLKLEGSNTERPLHLQSKEPFTYSISRFTPMDIWKCNHPSELTDISTGTDGYWLVTIDAAHRGVGTGACGPDTLEAYRIRPGVYRLSLKIW